MTTLAAGASASVSIPAGRVLQLQYGGTGLAVMGPGKRKGQPVALDGGDTLGPFDADQTLYLSCISGTLSYSVGTQGDSASGAVVQLPFSTTVPLSALQAAMPRTTVTGALALTVDASGAAEGNSTLLSFVSDGTNVPSISGSTALNTDFGYDNSQAGLQNFLQVVYLAGAARHQWFQPAVNTPIDVTAPTAGTATVENATATVINLVISEAADTSAAPSAASFAVTGHTVSSVAWGTSTRLDITVTPAFVNGEAARTLAYTPGTNPIKDVAGNLMAAFSGKAITNNVGGSLTPLVLSNRTLLTDNGNGTYTGQAGTNWTMKGYPATATYPNATDKKVSLRVPASAGAAILGIGSDGTPTYDAVRGLQISTSLGLVYWISAGVATQIEALGPAGTLYALARVGTALRIEKSTDNGASWSTIYTFAAVITTTALYPIFYTLPGNTIESINS